MPTTAAATLTRKSPDGDVAAQYTACSAHADFITTFLTCARSIERLGFRAEPQFTRDEHGAITGVVAVAVDAPQIDFGSREPWPSEITAWRCTRCEFATRFESMAKGHCDSYIGHHCEPESLRV